MSEIKKFNYLMLIVFCCLLFTVVQGQAPEIDIDLVWSTNTYVPIDYPGKALPTKGSSVRVIAVISSPTLDSEEIVYKWFLNNSIQKSDSGRGKDVFEFSMDENRSKRHLIQVKIENVEGALLGTSPYLYLAPQKPEIILKANIFSEKPNQAYQILADREIKFLAEPYFFNISDLDELGYSWVLDNQTVFQINDDESNVLNLKVGPIEKAIEQDLKVLAKNKGNAIEQAQSVVKLIFNPSNLNEIKDNNN